MDSRGIRRGQCVIAECDCEQYIPPADGIILKCEYCGDPPAKHRNLSVSSEPVSKDITYESPAVEVKAKPKWERTDLGWIENPSRRTGKFYNDVLPHFYQSYWKFCPHPKQFRQAFVVERERQYQVESSMEKLRSTYTFLKSDNSAAATRFLEGYIPKLTDSGAMNTLELRLEGVTKQINELKDTIKEHDESLFCYGGVKLQSGRDCAHSFNESKTEQLKLVQRNVEDMQSQLAASKSKYNDIFKFKKRKPKSDRTKVRNNNLKEKLRKERATTKQCMRMYVSLGGASEDYQPENGAFQITNLSLQDFEAVVVTKRDSEVVKHLRQIGCFREEALDLVNDYV